MTHPAVVVSLLMLVVNDHVLKVEYGNWLTGKLSDVAGLAFFPVLVVSGIEVMSWALGWSTPDRRRLLVRVAMATAVVFTLVQTLGPATSIYRHTAGLMWSGPASVVADVTDLIALPAVGMGWLLASGLVGERSSSARLASSLQETSTELASGSSR